MKDGYIENCIINRNSVNVITMNGYQMTCKILEEESDYIVLLCNNKKKLVFKHAISTIEPATLKLKLDKCAVL